MNTAEKRALNSYTYADYLTFSDEERLEIIDGVVYDMSPAPVRKHQKISVNLLREIALYLKGKLCEIYSAPFDVVFRDKNQKDYEIKNVVQPDLSIICDKDKLNDKGCFGAPDWIIEILSPSTSSKDFHEKYDLYEKFGVKEYWIVSCSDQAILVYTLNKKNKFENTARYTKEDKAKTIFEDLIINLEEVFEE